MSERPSSQQLLNITKAALDHAEAELVTQRNAIIEECARVAENIFVTDSLEHRLVDQVAAAIRALKDTTKEE